MQPFQPVVSPSASAIAGWMTSGNPSMPHAAVAQGPPGLVHTGKPLIKCLGFCASDMIVNVVFLITYECIFVAAFLKHPRTPSSATGMDYQTADSERLMKRMRTGQSDEVFTLEKPL